MISGKAYFASLAILFFLSIFTNSCNKKPSTVLKKNLIGDYLYDRRNDGYILLNTVYEKEGELYSQLEMTDYPVKMKLINEESAVFNVEFRQSGAFNFKFSSLGEKGYEKLEIVKPNSDFALVGYRVEEEIFKLRAHYPPMVSYKYRKPLQIDDGLPVGNIEDSGIDITRIYQFIDEILISNDYLHSLLILKDGKLFFEEYLNDWDPARLHRLQSVTKSFTSALIGIAVHEGFISSVNDPIYKYLPEYDALFDEAKKRILIKHLLSMSAGFEWNETATYYVDPEKGDFRLAEQSDDYIEYVLKKPLVSKPGEKYNYNSGYPNILGYIVQNRSGMKLFDFSLKYLFEPMGINRSYLANITGEDRASCAGGLRLTSRDMAKIGLLYLDKGLWHGKQIIPASWIEESTKGIIVSGEVTSYGYLWKRTKSLDGKYNIIFASGTGGQYIILLPELNTVIVTTAKPFTKKSDELAMLLLKQLMPIFN